MDNALIVVRQIAVMFLYMAAGYTLFKTGKLTLAGSRDIATLLLWVVLPCLLIESFCIEYSPETLRRLTSIAAENIRNCLEGKPYRNQING